MSPSHVLLTDTSPCFLLGNLSVGRQSSDFLANQLGIFRDCLFTESFFYLRQELDKVSIFYTIITLCIQSLFPIRNYLVLCYLLLTWNFGLVVGQRSLCSNLFSCATAKFGPLLRVHLLSTDLNHCVYHLLTQMSSRASQQGWIPKPSRRPSRN